MSQYFTIGTLSKLLNIPVSTLRFYGKKKLFLPEFRNYENNYQYYSSEQIKELCLLTMLREMNIPITQIEEILKTPKAPEELIRNIGEHKRIIQEQIQELQYSISKIEEIQSMLPEEPVQPEMETIRLQRFDERRLYFHKSKFKTTETSEWEIDIVGNPSNINVDKIDKPNALFSMGALCRIKDYITEGEPVFYASFWETRLEDDYKTYIDYPASDYLVLNFLDTEEHRNKAYRQIIDYTKENRLATEDILLERFVYSIIPDTYNKPSIMELQLRLKDG